MGYVGEGMADGVAVGNIFASPSPTQSWQSPKQLIKGQEWFIYMEITPVM